MSLGCARCGDCCENIRLDGRWVGLVDEFRDSSLSTHGDLTEDSAITPDHLPDIRFIAANWTETERLPDGAAIYGCTMFDADGRLCTVHEDRPPVCSEFPWYSDPDDIRHSRSADLRANCSYQLDIPVGLRRPDARPLLPLAVL